MARPMESLTSATPRREGTSSSGWLNLGVIAVASALVGGLATAWWYRETLTKLHQTEAGPANPEFGTSVYEPADES